MVSPRETRYLLRLRTTAWVVIIAFVTTTSDIALAFPSSTTLNPAPLPNDQRHLKDKLNSKDLFDDIRYDDPNPNNPPTPPNQPGVPPGQTQILENPFAQPGLPDSLTHFTQSNPLSSPGSVTCGNPDPQTGAVTCENTQGESYTIDSGGRVIAIHSLNASGAMEHRSITYDEVTHTMVIRLHDAGGLDTYQKYEMDAQFNPTRILEAGLVVNEQYVASRVYDYGAGTLTLHDLEHAGSYSVWHLDANGNAERALRIVGQYDFGEGFVNVDLEYLWEPSPNVSVRIKDYLTMRYFDLDMNHELTEYGNIVGENYQKLFEVVSYPNGTRVYKFYDADHPSENYYRTYERLEGGGVGRLLEFRGLATNQTFVHFGYIYHDAEHELTILLYDPNDETHGTYFTAAIAEGQLPGDVDFHNFTQYGSFTLENGLPVMKVQWVVSGNIWTFYHEENQSWFVRYEFLSGGNYRILESRGPPDGNLLYVYDYEHSLLRVFNYADFSYSTYVLLEDNTQGALLESGLFVIDANGNPSAVPVPSPPGVGSLIFTNLNQIPAFVGNPLTASGNQGTCTAQNNGTTRCDYESGEYYILDSNNHVIELYYRIGGNHFQTCTFVYNNNGTITMRLAVTQGHDLYQIFELVPGQTDAYRILEDGFFNSNNGHVILKTYTYTDTILTITNPNGNFTIIWELQNGAAWRILSSQSTLDGHLQENLKFIYQSGGSFYLLDLINKSYRLFGVDNKLMETGTFTFENDAYVYTKVYVFDYGTEYVTVFRYSIVGEGIYWKIHYTDGGLTSIDNYFEYGRFSESGGNKTYFSYVK